MSEAVVAGCMAAMTVTEQADEPEGGEGAAEKSHTMINSVDVSDLTCNFTANE